jgi:3-hydroxyisobutyrate dehydrogenase-like beta-hydroxyacid dehydrogenase
LDETSRAPHISPMRIGYIGLGIMGTGMVNNLAQKGHEVCVWNRTAAKAREAFPQLAHSRSPQELAAASEVVIACVSGPDAVENVLFAHDGVAAAARPGLVYIECSTIGPEQATSNAARLSQLGMQMLAAPVTGSKLGAQNGTLLFMTGGPDSLRQTLEPVLLCMGERVIHCGNVAQAFAVKLANNSLVSFMLEGLCEGATVIEKSGVPLRIWLDVIRSSVLASKFYDFKGDALLRRDFSTNFSLDLLLKDQTLMLDYATKSLARMPGLATIREVFQQGQLEGLGAGDMLGIVRLLERLGQSKETQS